ncbi:MAG: glycoside hydrolase family 88 protein [Sedimentisphaerales bacterium]|nr:glycoside hydrolase family 88 protein [Sedimentisphaerales bacterium]
MRPTQTILIPLLAVSLFCSYPGRAQRVSDATTALHALQPDYRTPYGSQSIEEIVAVLKRVHAYLDGVTPMQLVDRRSDSPITAISRAGENAMLAQGDFRLISYEWGVTYAGMLNAGRATGDDRFTDYVGKRLAFIKTVADHYRQVNQDGEGTPVRSVLQPRALDDAGSMCAAMIKAEQAGLVSGLRPMIQNYIDYISNDQFRLEDKTLARNRPLPNTLWLDDLFMSVPALARMGNLTGQGRYYDDAVTQVRQFADRMFVREKGLFMHGWVQGMEVHPAFFWGRCNGWALMAMVELLDVLPESHQGYGLVLGLLQEHIRGLAARQSGEGFWHQLLDHEDSYLETSATAIYTYCIARAVNRGWIDAMAYGPVAQLGWNAVSTKVNDSGQVEGTCVGTGMAFDPAFYYYRPVNIYAAHGYGPTLLAGAEIIEMTKKFKTGINDSAFMVEER